MQNIYVPVLEYFFADKSLYVLSSIIDGAPVTILEAMHCGVPVIVSSNCGTKDIVEEGVTGWVVENKNAAMIAQRILEAYQNRAKTEEMGKKGKAVLDAYDMHNFVSQLAGIVTGGIQ